LNFITKSPIDLNKVIALAHDAKAGAIVLFSGEVRNHHEGQSVDFLEYEAHFEMANKAISEIIEMARKQWSLHFVHAQHRIGKVAISECAVVVVTSSSHRDAAYEANRYIIDRIKAEAPIWKKEYFSEGNGVWR
jgi:molybdopterin synthase catalytic subunit